MRLMAVEGPVSRISRIEFEGPHLAYADIHRDFRPPLFGAQPAAVGARDKKLVAMQVERVIGHGQVAHADADPSP